MYVPASFSETNLYALLDLIRRHPLGMLVSAGPSGLLASPAPFLHREKEGKPVLVAHLARANPHWQDLQAIDECLIVFRGADNYVSPNWYPSKQATHKVVPTWNYEMVQVRGIPTVIESANWLRGQVSEFTDVMEQPRAAPWKLDDAPADFIDTQLKAIVGLEIAITQIQGKWKMSQNRSEEDARGVVAGLSNPDDAHANGEVAAIMTSRLKR
jgi:transcriptional regulator